MLSMEEQLLDTWKINNRIDLYLLDAIAPEVLGISAAKGRNAAQQFAHIHNVRLMWLKSGAPDLLEGLEKIEKEVFDKEALRSGLEASGRAIEGLLACGIAAGKIKGFKPHPTAFLGYLIAHDAYHRGEIGIILTQLGHPLDQKTSYGMWEWGSR
jgi:uncharacterized damage-inducible protein DinB